MGECCTHHWWPLIQKTKTDTNPTTCAVQEASIAGGPFDYESIMIYDSTTGAKHGDPKKPKTWVIYRKDNGKPVWTGGNKNPYEAKISGIDVARVKYLYPPMDEHR